MTVILAIETATQICSAALFENNRLLTCVEEGGQYSHAEKLNLFIDKAMEQAGIKRNDIDAVAVGKGPGSYTGLRIGVSTAKGISYSLGKPLIGINSLQIMAAGARQHLLEQHVSHDSVLCPMIDARRMEVYAAIYDMELKELRPASADILDNSEFYHPHSKRSSFIYFGNGSEKCRELFEDEPNMMWTEIPGLIPSARHMGELAMEKFRKEMFEDVAYFEPFYLKAFRATTPKRIL